VTLTRGERGENLPEVQHGEAPIGKRVLDAQTGDNEKGWSGRMGRGGNEVPERCKYSLKRDAL